MKNTAIIITTYNSGSYIDKLLSSIVKQARNDLFVVIADDGSTDDTVARLNAFKKVYGQVKILELSHKERGYARSQALKFVLERQYPYLLILDADMVLEDRLIDECMMTFKQDPRVGALVLKETPVSSFSNLMTQVKVFERTVVNNSKRVLDKNSIEAARFWRRQAYITSGGINPNQIAFEETQPTIRYIEGGGLIIKHMGAGLLHDEKKVTLRNIFKKKQYHFQMMKKTFETENEGLLKALKRWYFFRPVMYRKCNMILYLKHPILTLGMIFMYLVLTSVGGFEIIRGKLLKKEVA